MKTDRKKQSRTGGFTLVELIVDIAILGILAGVGTVAYTGYVRAANESVDEQLYNDILYAGALGSYVNPDANGIVHVSKDGASVTTDEADYPEYVDIVEQWLENVFGSDWQNTVRYRTDKYANDYSRITLPDPDGISLTEEQQQLVNNYLNSNFAGNETELAGSVDTLTGLFAQFIAPDGALNLDQLADNGWMSEEDLANFKEQYGFTDDSNPQEVANAIVFYLADKANGVTAEQVFETAGDSLNNVDAVMETYGPIPAAAMMYGLVTGYANSGLASDEFMAAYANTPGGITDVLNLVSAMGNDANSGQYINDHGQTDLDGYLSALQLIGSYQDRIDISGENAFSDPEVLALIQNILNSAR